MADVTLVDYGVGNIKAYLHVFERLNLMADTAATPSAIKDAKRLILPGVGAFDWAMARLSASGLRDALDAAVLLECKPVLGVCVGMQMMADRSDEGQTKGLGWVKASVVRMQSAGNQQVPLPHMGWNNIQPQKAHPLLAGLDKPSFYFLHSYAFVPEDSKDALASTVYGGAFTSVIEKSNIMATQFHPEKSHRWGMQLLRNFVGI